MKKKAVILKELKHHLPFTFFASLAAGVLVAFIYLNWTIPSESIFELLHPAHVLVSAAATSAIYWKYKKSVVGGFLVGIFGAILIGSLSDILLPWIAGNLFLLKTGFHLPILEDPILILGVALIGAVAGMKFNLFNVSHSVHVFLSIFASLFYILAFSMVMNVWIVLLISFIVFLAVFIPCCISDIVFPILFVGKQKR